MVIKLNVPKEKGTVRVFMSNVTARHDILSLFKPSVSNNIKEITSGIISYLTT